jgi:Uma2 family endonuclease
MTMVLKTPEIGFKLSDGEAIPPLRDGDRLTASEFHRRYSAMPHIKKAELINGVVRMGSPVREDHHGYPHVCLGGWLGYYLMMTPGLLGGDNNTIQLGDEDEPQPDLQMRIARGGQSHRNERGYVVGPPELVAEVSASSLDRDMGERLDMYRSFGVQEYLIWRVEEGDFLWHRLREGVYELLPLDEAGVIRSEVFPGLWLDTRAMLEGRGPDLFATLQRGMASEEYRAFASRIRGE